MGESLTEQYRVREEGSWVVNLFSQGRKMTVPEESASANSVPAAAVIRRMQALSGMIGRKGSVGGTSSLLLKRAAQLHKGGGN
jgi:hypothetical protein